MKKHAIILSEHAISEYSDVYIQRLAEAIERPDGLIRCLDDTIRRLDVIIQLLGDNIQQSDESIGEPDVNREKYTAHLNPPKGRTCRSTSLPFGKVGMG